MATSSDNKKISKKIDELKAGVDWFYSDDFQLDEAADRYKKLNVLAQEIEKDLNELKNEISVIDKDFSK